jgi:acyl-CoA thioesterase I
MISGKRALLASVLILAACGGERPDVLRRGSGEGSVTSTTGAAAVSDDPTTRLASRATEDTDSTPAQVVAFLGTSLTAGYGLADPSDRYTDVVQRRIDEEGLPYTVVNAGVSGETSRGGLERIEWVLRSSPRVLVIELGANDGLRGIDPASMAANLQAILARARAVRSDTEFVIVGMQAPPNMGPTYAAAFREVFSDLAETSGARLVPFLLEGVGGVSELNQADGIHPTAEGHAILADNVWAVLGPLLRELAL